MSYEVAEGLISPNLPSLTGRDSRSPVILEHNGHPVMWMSGMWLYGGDFRQLKHFSGPIFL